MLICFRKALFVDVVRIRVQRRNHKLESKLLIVGVDDQMMQIPRGFHLPVVTRRGTNVIVMLHVIFQMENRRQFDNRQSGSTDQKLIYQLDLSAIFSI